MQIRRAQRGDIPGIDKLLTEVNKIHHDGRPDLFDLGRKYTDDQLAAMVGDDSRPIFVATGDAGEVLGYAFCVHQQIVGDPIRTTSRRSTSTTSAWTSPPAVWVSVARCLTTSSPTPARAAATTSRSTCGSSTPVPARSTSAWACIPSRPVWRPCSSPSPHLGSVVRRPRLRPHAVASPVGERGRTPGTEAVTYGSCGRPRPERRHAPTPRPTRFSPMLAGRLLYPIVV